MPIRWSTITPVIPRSIFVPRRARLLRTPGREWTETSRHADVGDHAANVFAAKLDWVALSGYQNLFGGVISISQMRQSENWLDRRRKLYETHVRNGCD